MNMEQTECSETSAYKIQTPGNYPEESIQNLEHGEILKSRITSISLYHVIFYKCWPDDGLVRPKLVANI